jgi:hypothetical protein
MWEQIRAAEQQAQAAAAAQAARGNQPVDDSVLKNIERFVVGFFASLFPAWRPPPV